MCRELTKWEEAVKFHGHACPGLAMGVRASEVALEKLGINRAIDEELVAFVYCDACGVDGVQVITGCTLGKGNLFFIDHGKQAYTIAKRNGGEAVRIVFKNRNYSEENKRLRKKVFAGEASPEEAKKFKEMQEENIRYILEGPEDEILTVKKVNIEIPKKARIFDSLCCQECGEYFMESRARIQNGKVVCLDCFDEYKRFKI